MTKPKFGRLEKVNLQELWKNDTDDFLRWLSQPENLAMLSHGLGIPLVCEPSEEGGTVTHLVCKDQDSGRTVLVENPFGRAQNSHLGEMLSHSAAYTMVTVVWIASEFPMELRGVLDWLNRVTGEAVAFYGVEVEFWHIDGSPYAPRFTLVCQPAGHPLTQSPQVADAGGSEQESEEALAQADRKPVTATGMLRKVRALDPGDSPSGMPVTQSGSHHNPAVPEPVRRYGGEGGSSSGLLRRFHGTEREVTPSGMLRGVNTSGKRPAAGELERRAQIQGITDIQQLYLEFWTQFWETEIRWDGGLPPQKPMMQGWVTFPVGKEDFYLIAFLSADHKMAGMGLVIEGAHADEYFHVLQQERAAIEREIGGSLDWRELPAKEECHIYLHKRGVDPAERSLWPDYMAWFAEQLESFTQVFGSRVRVLDAELGLDKDEGSRIR